jgi:hypothetical protein
VAGAEVISDHEPVTDNPQPKKRKVDGTNGETDTAMTA